MLITMVIIGFAAQKTIQAASNSILRGLDRILPCEKVPPNFVFSVPPGDEFQGGWEVNFGRKIENSNIGPNHCVRVPGGCKRLQECFLSNLKIFYEVFAFQITVVGPAPPPRRAWLSGWKNLIFQDRSERSAWRSQGLRTVPGGFFYENFQVYKQNLRRDFGRSRHLLVI